MGEKDLYDYWSDTYKVHSLDWSTEKAASILREWQASFTAEVARVVAEQKLQRKYDVSAYSSSQLDEIVEDFSEFRIPDMMLGLLAVVSISASRAHCRLILTACQIDVALSFQLLYSGVTLYRWNGVVRSQAAVGVAGVFLVALGISSGLGLCALIGVTFNAITSQTVPFFVLGIGVNSMFVLAHTYGEIIAGEGIDRRVSEKDAASVARPPARSELAPNLAGADASLR